MVTTNFLQVPRTRVKETVLFIIIVNMLAKLTVAHLRDGIIWIMTMKGFGWANYNSSLGTSITQFMLSCLPLKPKALYAVNSPWFISVILTIVKPFVSAKMKKRLFVVDENDLRQVFGVDLLPPEVGGRNMFEHLTEKRYAWYAEELQKMCSNLPEKRSKLPWRTKMAAPKDTKSYCCSEKSRHFPKQLYDVDEIKNVHYFISNPGEEARRVIVPGDLRAFELELRRCRKSHTKKEKQLDLEMWPGQNSTTSAGPQRCSSPTVLRLEIPGRKNNSCRTEDPTEDSPSDTSFTFNPSYPTIVSRGEQGEMLSDRGNFSKISSTRLNNISTTLGRLVINRTARSQQSVSTPCTGTVSPYSPSPTYSEKQIEWAYGPIEKKRRRLSEFSSSDITFDNEDEKTVDSPSQPKSLYKQEAEPPELIPPKQCLSKVLSEKILEQARLSMKQSKRQASPTPLSHNDGRPRFVSTLPELPVLQLEGHTDVEESQKTCRGSISVLCSFCTPSSHEEGERVIFWKKRSNSSFSLSDENCYNSEQSEQENRISVSHSETKKEIFF